MALWPHLASSSGFIDPGLRQGIRLVPSNQVANDGHQTMARHDVFHLVFLPAELSPAGAMEMFGFQGHRLRAFALSGLLWWVHAIAEPFELSWSKMPSSQCGAHDRSSRPSALRMPRYSLEKSGSGIEPAICAIDTEPMKESRIYLHHDQQRWRRVEAQQFSSSSPKGDAVVVRPTVPASEP